MEGKFVVKINNKLHIYTQYDEIPNEIGAVISFEPNYPSPPHTEEQHHEIEQWNNKLQELLKRETR